MILDSVSGGIFMRGVVDSGGAWPPAALRLHPLHAVLCGVCGHHDPHPWSGHSPGLGFVRLVGGHRLSLHSRADLCYGDDHSTLGTSSNHYHSLLYPIPTDQMLYLGFAIGLRTHRAHHVSGAFANELCITDLCDSNCFKVTHLTNYFN